MATTKSEQIRLQIIKATDELLYHKGYNLMSFSDIADASGVPRGNINYHFKTKQEVLFSVIEYRLQQMKSMLEDWDKTITDPFDRLKRFAKIPLIEREDVSQFGCPMGSLNTELGKTQADLQAISQMQFGLFRKWLKKQFHECVPEKDEATLAMHLLVRTQGLAVMSHAYADKALIKREFEGTVDWIESLL